MPRIRDLFRPHTARAAGFVHYAHGEAAYVTNGFRNNGVLGFVKPKPDDPVYRFLGIAVSAFCEATVQIPPFVARGNGGSGLTVLEPRRPMTADHLAYIAAYINTTIRWRFSWSRMATADRLQDLEIPELASPLIRYDVRRLLPPQSDVVKPSWQIRLKPFPLHSMFEMFPGDYHNTSALPEGDIALISCGDAVLPQLEMEEAFSR